MTDNRISHIRQILASDFDDGLKCRTISVYLDSFEFCPEAGVRRSECVKCQEQAVAERDLDETRRRHVTHEDAAGLLWGKKDAERIARLMAERQDSGPGAHEIEREVRHEEAFNADAIVNFVEQARTDAQNPRGGEP